MATRTSAPGLRMCQPFRNCGGRVRAPVRTALSGALAHLMLLTGSADSRRS